RRQPRGDRRLAAGRGPASHRRASARFACPRARRGPPFEPWVRQRDVMRRLAIALVHHPVVDGRGAIVTTAVTNLDVHDLARSARTYGCSDYFVVHPIEVQRELATRIVHHWTEGSSAKRIPDRKDALALVRAVPTLEDAVAALGSD